MTLLIASQSIEQRRALVANSGAPLAPLADSLAAELEPYLVAPPDIPSGKALLSRTGGRCPADGAELDFDPRSPHAHRCPLCGAAASGDFHDRWWLYPYHLWLAERTVHASVLHLLRGDPRHAAFARHLLLGYADRYLQYPNRDNVLGPSRLFFSTYLESLWLLHISIAASLAETAGDSETADIVRDRIVEPAASLIAEYDEGFSNRQVWNGAALVAAHALLGRPTDNDAIIGALGHSEAIIEQAVGVDGSWYEGDNYHQFAHRGLWYVVALGESLGYEFQPESIARFESGFAAPFLSALPDFTYPARKDSRYGASLRQWRFAESVELGLARRDDPVLRWAAGKIYADDLAPGDTGRWRSSGEAERHSAPVRLSRADLGWRSLLFARAELPPDPGAAPGSLTIMSQGLTIHRRERGEVYVALDWGESGGGHGHPDRLNLLFSHGTARWLDDLGTGSYVDRSLHWYRSTLAHNAPLVNGVSQQRVRGDLLAAGARGEFEIASARLLGAAPGVRIRRTVVTSSTYFVDEVRWDADHAVRVDLPLHFAGACTAATFVSRALDGGTGLEDGFDFVTDVLGAPLPAGHAMAISASDDVHHANARVWSGSRAMFYTGNGPGQPAPDRRRFYLVRQEGSSGVIRTVWSWSRPAPRVVFGADSVTVRVGMVTHRHYIADDSWAVDAPGALDVAFDIREAAVAESPAAREEDTHEPRTAFATALPATFNLGESHYRRTEEAWRAAGAPTGRVDLRVEGRDLIVDAHLATEHLCFVPVGAVNPFDNESADINGHGVQLYVSAARARGGWVIVPDAGSADARCRRIPGWLSTMEPAASWRRVDNGFTITMRLPLDLAPGDRFALDLIINDAAPGRDRRRGQLVMSGAAGEFAYLRGDRHDPARLILFAVNSST